LIKFDRPKHIPVIVSAMVSMFIFFGQFEGLSNRNAPSNNCIDYEDEDEQNEMVSLLSLSVRGKG